MSTAVETRSEGRGRPSDGGAHSAAPGHRSADVAGGGAGPSAQGGHQPGFHPAAGGDLCPAAGPGGGGRTARTGVYLLGGWAAPLGIVLVVDLLSALMLLLGAMMGLATLVYALARWHRAGVHFHPLFQLFLMGLNGAFLTGDLFNLFVFFEVMLAASYGLALHGLGAQRVKAGQ